MARACPRTRSQPTSPSGSSFPSSSVTRTSKPGTTVPIVPGRTAPGRAEMKMCHISAVPSPSSSSTPNAAIQRSQSSTGSASPAEVASRSEERSASPAAGWLTIWFTIVGTLTSTVGRCRRICSKSASAVQRSGKSTVRAPTEKGKKRLVPIA